MDVIKSDSSEYSTRPSITPSLFPPRIATDARRTPSAVFYAYANPTHLLLMLKRF